MITLLPFEKTDFDRFKSWIKSPEELLQFAGPYFSFPITDKQLLHYLEDPKRRPYKITLLESDMVIGHCELNFERDIPRLSRILIAQNTERNKGYGKQTIHALLKLLFIDDRYDQADLNVYSWNSNAIRCYENVGFRINEEVTSETVVGNETWKGLNMQISKSDWIKQATLEVDIHCPTCPSCEKEKRPDSGFLSLLSSPARNALLQQGIDSMEKLAGFTEKDLLRLHGFGKASLPPLRQALFEKGLTFKE